jgi:hypothetical protein
MSDIITILKSSYPKYNTKQPSTNKTLNYRPFTVREERALLLSKDTGRYSDFLSTITEIVDQCFSDNPVKINSRKLPIFDVEYMFLKIRQKSVSEVIKVSFVCPETKEKINIEINIEDIEVNTSPENNKNIKLSNDLIVNMKYPPFEYLIENSFKNDEGNIDLFDMVLSSIESIQTKDQLIQDIPKETINEFIEGLTKQQYQKILNFFVKIPKLEHSVPYKTSDGVERKITFRGIKDFFR